MAKMTVEDSSLTAVADAIRAKGGTTDALVFPDGFVGAIGNIQSGGSNDTLAKIIDRSITDITSDMFAGCTSIGANAFKSCTNLKSVFIPGNVEIIYNYAFSECPNLVDITFSEGLEKLGGSVFTGCSVVSITFPSTLVGIGGNTFKECTKLTTIICKRPTPPSISVNVFLNSNNISKIIVPVGCLDAYKNATNWSVFADIMEEATE